jgi:hypothetical protein
MRRMANRVKGDEKGQAFVWVLIMLVLTGLIIAPLLGFMGSGVKISQAHEEEMLRLYAADAGVEYALWHLLANPGPEPSGVKKLYPPPLTVNAQEVKVEIKGVWILDGIELETTPGQDITVTGEVRGDSYQIRIITPSDISVARLGVWLPHGFLYKGEPWTHRPGMPVEPFPDPPSIIRPARGGIILVWDFDPYWKVEEETTYINFRIDPAVGPPGDFVWLIEGACPEDDPVLHISGGISTYRVTVRVRDPATGESTHIAYVTREEREEEGVGVSIITR